jgi:hypothetical protein
MDITQWQQEWIASLRDQLKSLNDVGGGLAGNIVIPPKLTLEELLFEPIGVIRDLLTISEVEEKRMQQEKRRQAKEEIEKRKMMQAQKKGM